ncbi:MAG: hypothetical protein IH897_09530 [Planctomycetes bacterium]|nr:hypothetical protein [Planctomycetota bacterium]
MKVFEEGLFVTDSGLWPDTEAHFGEPDAGPTFLRVLARPFSSGPFGGLKSSYRWFLELYYKHLAYRRMAALSLAIRLYEVEYGRRPDALDRLVPAFVESIPIDPFSPTGERLQYVRDEQRNIIYSVGFNGLDDGGSFDPSTGPWRDEQGDFVFHLDGRPTDGSSDDESGQAVDDEKDTDDQAENAGDDDDREEQPQQRK